MRLEAERDAIASGQVRDHPHADRIVGLTAFKGIGGLVRHRAYRRGLSPRLRQPASVGKLSGSRGPPLGSGGSSRDRGISRIGNPRARSAAIERVRLWLRHRPQSALSLWFRERVGMQKRRTRRSTIVAMARKLTIALWLRLETGLVPDGAVLKA